MRKLIKSCLTFWVSIVIFFSILPINVCASGAPNGIYGNGTGGIYIDINAEPYTTFAQIENWGKYAYGTQGCAWFASARVKQLTGVGNMIYSGSSWWNNGAGLYGFSTGQTIREKSIACYKGHVAIVEKIEGNTVYLSEGGYSSENVGAQNGYSIIRATTESGVRNNGDNSFLGFVYLSGQTGGESTASYTITNRDYKDLTDTSVTLQAMLDKTTTNMSECGVFLGTSTSNMTQIKEKVSVGTEVRYMSYGTAKWYGTLTPGTTYWGPLGSFTTTGSAPDTQAPVISNVQVTNITENGYTVSCTVTDNVGVNRVQFPTWKASETSEGCAWYHGTQSGNTWTFTYTDAAVEGDYVTHIYAYDDVGNYAYYAVPYVYVSKTPDIPEDSFGQDAVYRVYGKNRYETSYKAADVLKVQLGVQKFQTVIIASGKDFPDALAGSYLAGKKNAPILMIDEKSADTLTAYIKANLEIGGTIYILGGESAIPSKLLDNLGGYQLCRLAGATRYETNLRILEEAGIENQDILVCTGNGFADSLSASATGKQDNAVKYMNSRGIGEGMVLGGDGLISDEAVKEIYGVSSISIWK